MIESFKLIAVVFVAIGLSIITYPVIFLFIYKIYNIFSNKRKYLSNESIIIKVLESRGYKNISEKDIIYISKKWKSGITLHDAVNIFLSYKKG